MEGYRSVDFPKELKDGGPLHLSLAVKDVNGRNIAEDKAVYFTAHYDKAGKLQEVSTPMPIKFMGKGDDVIGYIEREGNIYTLPVTQGKYKEMMREVAINKEMAVDMSQTTSIEAKDLAQIKNPEENKIKGENKQQTQSWVKGEISKEARLKRMSEEELRKKNNQTSQSHTPEPSDTMLKLGKKEGQTKEPSKAKGTAEIKSSPIKKVSDGVDKNEGPTKTKETVEVKPSPIKKVSEKTDLTDYVNKMKEKLEKKLNPSLGHTTLPKQPKQNKSINPRAKANSTHSL